MDWLTFTAEIFKAAAWPATAMGIALLFRPQLSALLSRMNKGRLGSAEFEFEQAVQVLAAQMPGPAPGTAQPTGTAAAMARASVPPREAIAAAWRDLEHVAQMRAQTVPRPPPLCAPDMALYQKLAILQEQAIRNTQFHPSAQAVAGYVQLARALQARIQGAGGSAQKPG